MDSDGGGLRGPERHLVGVCTLALADGVVDWGICGDIHTRE